MPKRRKTAAKSSPSRAGLPLLLLLMIVFWGAGYWYANQKRTPPESPRGTVKIPKIEPGNNDVVNTEVEVPVKKTEDPIRQALEAAVANDGKSPSAFPTGTKLVSLDVKDGTAVIELSPEFRKLNNSGDTTESLAYDGLRKTLAQFPSVKYMRVMVDGKVFEGEHSGAWAEVAVRDDHARVEDRP